VSTYYGKCDLCGEKSSLEAMHPETGDIQKVCFECWDNWLTNQEPKKKTEIDPDDLRKYGR
jgi:hypothetical protein